jgi:hypothetical protein
LKGVNSNNLNSPTVLLVGLFFFIKIDFEKIKKVVFPVVSFGKAQSALAKRALPKSTNRV